MNRVAMISGHLDLTQEEFDAHYKPRIDEAIAANCDFVVGDARGADVMAQAYLSRRWLPYNFEVTVYHMFEKPRHCWDNFPTKGGFQTDHERDVAMTLASGFDIAWVRPGRETSGTAKNIARRSGASD